MVTTACWGLVAAAGPVPLAGSATSGTASTLPTEKPWRLDKDLGSFNLVTAGSGAQDLWRSTDASGSAITGDGIGVAVIDSGVSPVEGLAAPGKVIDGPDLSFDAGDPELRHLDGFGHGTHMAGIIAGRDPEAPAGQEHQDQYYVGMAPGAHIVNVKVAAADGSADVSQVIAGIDWVVQHRDDPGLNIRVLSLSYGTTSLQPYEVDPLAHAVEAAWHNGIVVVVSAGNDGAEGTTLTNPAIDPYVLAVGAVDHGGTKSLTDDQVADFSSVGSAARHPDLVAPGRSILGYRVPGSYLDLAYPSARAADASGDLSLFRGSGTSQATAVTAGAAALLLDERPGLTPDQVKHVLATNARPVLGSSTAQGAGQLQLKGTGKVLATDAPVQSFVPSTGTGSLELARGGSHVADPTTGEELVGELDIFGRTWDAQTWADDALAGMSWRGGTWNGSTWAGDGWQGSLWTGMSWRYADWSGTSWSGMSWRTGSWSGMSWRGDTWTGMSWRDESWSGMSWRGMSWRTGAWSGVVWR